MNLSREELLSKPHLLKLITRTEDQLALGLIPKPPSHQELTNSKPLTKTTSKTTSAKPPSKPELQSHAEFLHWIKRANKSLPPDLPILALHADPTHKSGIIPGWPDFSLFHKSPDFQPLFIEFKRPKQGRLSPAQELIHRYLSSLGYRVFIAFYSSVAIQVTINHFDLNLP